MFWAPKLLAFGTKTLIVVNFLHRPQHEFCTNSKTLSTNVVFDNSSSFDMILTTNLRLKYTLHAGISHRGRFEETENKNKNMLVLEIDQLS